MKAHLAAANGHERSRSTAVKSDVFDLGEGQTTTPGNRALLFTNGVWVL